MIVLLLVMTSQDNTFGFTYGLEYKGFDFSMMWQGVGKRNKWMRGESVEAFHNNNEVL